MMTQIKKAKAGAAQAASVSPPQAPKATAGRAPNDVFAGMVPPPGAAQARRFVPHPMDSRLPIACPWPKCFRSHERDEAMVKFAGNLAYRGCIATGLGLVPSIIVCEEARSAVELIERKAIAYDVSECTKMGCGPVYS